MVTLMLFISKISVKLHICNSSQLPTAVYCTFHLNPRTTENYSKRGKGFKYDNITHLNVKAMPVLWVFSIIHCNLEELLFGAKQKMAEAVTDSQPFLNLLYSRSVEPRLP